MNFTSLLLQDIIYTLTHSQKIELTECGTNTSCFFENKVRADTSSTVIVLRVQRMFYNSTWIIATEETSRGKRRGVDTVYQQRKQKKQLR